jgi:hypothetical protein
MERIAADSIANTCKRFNSTPGRLASRSLYPARAIAKIDGTNASVLEYGQFADIKKRWKPGPLRQHVLDVFLGLGDGLLRVEPRPAADDGGR